jgi:hypothetical protein
MNKALLGLVLGLFLGALDGATAWFYEEVRAQGAGYMTTIILGSTAKGLVAGLLAGWAARKWNSLAAGLGVGAVAGALFAWIVVATGKGDPVVDAHPWAIIIPGTIVGALCGIACFKYGKPAPRPA